MLGHQADAERLLQKLDFVAHHAHNLREKQNAYLHSADGHALLGKNKDALVRARHAFNGELTKLQTPLSVGAYSRWLVVVALATKTTGTVIGEIEQLLKDRDQFDRIDKTEVLCAKVWLDHKMGRSNKEEEMGLQSELAELPQAVTVFLQRTGFLDTSVLCV
jgi:hypothetical protein